MEELSLYLRMIMGIMFISSFISKVINYQKHKLTIMDYQLIPNYLIPIFAILLLLIELLIGLGLLGGVLLREIPIYAAGLLFIYSVAVIINLIRGRKRISCGCGGLAGDHNL